MPERNPGSPRWPGRRCTSLRLTRQIPNAELGRKRNFAAVGVMRPCNTTTTSVSGRSNWILDNGRRGEKFVELSLESSTTAVAAQDLLFHLLSHSSRFASE